MSNCDHKWKETQGIFKVYKDCTECGLKWEDYVGKKSEKSEKIVGKNYIEEAEEEDILAKFEKMLGEFPFC